VEAAIENAVPMPAIAASLFARFVSRQEDDVAMKAVAAMRAGFGGHAVTRKDVPPTVSPPPPTDG
jgi:6-phosphogluconate dehydrogenase